MEALPCRARDVGEESSIFFGGVIQLASLSSLNVERAGTVRRPFQFNVFVIARNHEVVTKQSLGILCEIASPRFDLAATRLRSARRARNDEVGELARLHPE